jgi:hypothetical protein
MSGLAEEIRERLLETYGDTLTDESLGYLVRESNMGERWYSKYSDQWYERDWPLTVASGIVDIVDSYLGAEGGGENAYVVFSLTPTDGRDISYWRLHGYYSSWDGSSWDDDALTEVFPKATVEYVTQREL